MFPQNMLTTSFLLALVILYLKIVDISAIVGGDNGTISDSSAFLHRKKRNCMSASTTLDTGIPPEARSQKKFRLSWQTLLLYLFALAFLAVGLLMRLRDLGLTFDRDGYDEGVYWQSLRAMSTGHSLYQQIFYSQPPFFLLSIYPIYTFFGQTIWSARLGVAVMSLFGLLGALLLGKALGGRLGAVVAALLLLADPFYL